MIFFLSVRYIFERKAFHYVSLIAVASLFHLSVLIVAPTYLVTYLRTIQKLR